MLEKQNRKLLQEDFYLDMTHLVMSMREGRPLPLVEANLVLPELTPEEIAEGWE